MSERDELRAFDEGRDSYADEGENPHRRGSLNKAWNEGRRSALEDEEYEEIDREETGR